MASVPITSPPVPNSGATATAPSCRRRRRFVVRVVGQARIGQVVVRPGRLGGGRRQAIDAATDREALAVQPGARLRIGVPGHDHGNQVLAVVIHQGQVRAVRAEQPLRGVDHLLQRLAGVVHLHDAPRDLAERALHLHAARQLHGLLAQALLQGDALADVAHRAVAAGELAVDHRAQAVDLHGDVGPVAVQHVQPVLLRLLRLIHHPLPVLEHVRQRLGRHDLGEVMPDQLLPAPQPIRLRTVSDR